MGYEQIMTVWGATEHGWRKGPWTAEEDRLLIDHVNSHGEGQWNNVSRLVGLRRNGKSCRLRWVNYLRPDLKRGQITPHEKKVILDLHARWGNRWSMIARSLPGRTDNEIKNYWRTHFKKKGVFSSQSPEKIQARLLRWQQFQLMQQQRLQHQYQHEELDKSLLDGSDDKVPSFAHWKQENAHASALDDQTFLFYSMVNEFATMPETTPSEDTIMWDGLWNMDDLNGTISKRASTLY